ncbi:MAG: glucosamine-6-phosphate deaminase [Anaerolineae bacterium]|nr:glucosamine-6-phosphate deaminase [Anaerolineae bacterium]
MNTQPIRSFQIDQMPVRVFASNEALGQRAAGDLAETLKQAVAAHGRAAVILATGNSQLSFMKALRVKPDLPWDKIVFFHMDEYLGMSDRHPASFAKYIREKLVDWVHPQAFYPLRGDAHDVQAELERYRALLDAHPADVCVLGVGENGHLAFNDPPADFKTEAVIHIVNLDRKCRMQQVGEGHFPTLDDVPTEALSLTVPALLAATKMLCLVPEARKAQAIKAALEGPVSPDCPASILRTQSHVTMYLDVDSAALLA